MPLFPFTLRVREASTPLTATLATGFGLAGPVVLAAYYGRKAGLRFAIRHHRSLLSLCGRGAAIGAVLAVGAFAEKLGIKGKGLLGAAAGAILVWGYTAKPRFPAPKSLPRALCNERFTPAKVPGEVDAIVIGSGIGGLTSAATLSCMGWRVLVLEAHPDRSGGGTHEYDLGSGWTFDSGYHYGPSLQQYTMWWATQSTYSPPVPFDPLVNEEDGVFDKVVVMHEGEQHTLGFKHQEAHIKDLFDRVAGNEAACSQLVEYLHCSNKCLLMFPLWWLMRFLPYPSAGARVLRWVLWLLGWHSLAGLTCEEIFRLLQIQDPVLQTMLHGIWQNTGTPPMRCSFVMGAAVNRGFPLVTPSYPRGGSQALARHLAHTIEAGGGKVLHRCAVTRIRTEGTRVIGVDVDSLFISAPVVISACGYNNTFDKLLDKQLTAALGVPGNLEELGVHQSCGFVMVNCGIRGTPEDLGLKANNQNLWYTPLRQGSGDFFSALKEYFRQPLAHDDCPFMFTFPSVKNRMWHSSQPKHADMTTVQILALAEHQWFAKWQDEKTGMRGRAYEDLKEEWSKRALSVLYKYYPQFKGKLELVDVSTPLSAQHYLSSWAGSATGLESCPARFTDHAVGTALDMKPWGGVVQGLWLTGQDQFICGVPMAHLSGMVTALRIAGPVSAAAWVLHGARLTLHGILPFTSSA